MIKFLCAYKLKGFNYGSYIFAPDYETAVKLIDIRNIGEIEDYLSDTAWTWDHDFSELDFNTFMKKLPDIIHQLNFAGWIGMKSGKVDVDDVVGDYGVLHELSHLNAQICKGEYTDEEMVDYLKRKIRILYYKVPGFAPYSKKYWRM